MIRYRQCFDSPRVRRERKEQRKGKEIAGGEEGGMGGMGGGEEGGMGGWGVKMKSG